MNNNSINNHIISNCVKATVRKIGNQIRCIEEVKDGCRLRLEYGFTKNKPLLRQEREQFKVKESVPSFIGLTPGLYDPDEVLKHWVETHNSDDFPYREPMLGIEADADDTTYVCDSDYINEVHVCLHNLFEAYSRSEFEDLGKRIREAVGMNFPFEEHFKYDHDYDNLSDEKDVELKEYSIKITTKYYVIEFEASTGDYSSRVQRLSILPVFDLEENENMFERYKLQAQLSQLEE